MQKYLATAVISLGLLIGSSQAATISGTVTDSASQTPISNAIVQVRSGSQVLATDTTDDQGAFSLSAGDSGSVTVRASLSGTYNSKSIDTMLSATPYTLNFALAKIITSTISGIITDSAAGTPLSGVIVRLGAGGGSSSRDTTGADGAYTFLNVRTGEQTIQASLAGYINKSITVAVSSADPVTANIAIVKTIYAKVSGIVKDSVTGTPLAGVVVRLGSGGGSSRRDTTGEDGAYSFDSVASGTQSIQVSKSQYTTKTVQIAISSSDPVTADVLMSGVTYVKVTGIVSDSVAGTALAGAVVSIGGVRDTTGADGAFSIDSVRSGSQTLSVSLSRYKSKTVQLTISGTEPVNAPVALVGVVYASVSGIITDTATGLPLSGAVVRIGSGINRVTDTTGTDGAFLFAEVQEGTQTITVSCAKYTGKTAQVTVAGSTAVTADFALVAIVYGSVSGVVTDSTTGTALAGAVVRLGNGFGMSGSVDTTGTDGAYSFAEAATGNQTITVTYPKYTTKTAQVTIAGGTPVTANFALVATIFASVSGIVTDSITGTPLSGVEVRISSAGTLQYDTTGADGAYQFTEIAAGSAPLKITAAGYTVRRDTLTITTSTPVTYNIAMGEKTSVISRNTVKHSTEPQLLFSGKNLIVTNIIDNGILSLFSLNGICIYHTELNRTSKPVTLPNNLRTHGSSVIVRIKTQGKTFAQRMLVFK